MRARGRTVFIVTFLAPATALYALLVLWPVAQAFVFCLYRWRGVSGNKTFVGVENFARLYKDKVFWTALGHNFTLLLAAGSVILVLALAVAHALQGKGIFVRVLRGVYLFPHIISLVVVSILWMFIYNPSFGLLTGALRAVGLERYEQPWLGNPSTALPAVGVTYAWFAVGFFIMLLAAGLQSIPAEVFDAAQLDGATGLFKVRKITLPMIWPVMRVAVVYLVISVLNVFALVFLMTVGGPDRSTEVMLTYLYERAFKFNDFGLATTIAVANLVIVLVISGLVFRLSRRDPQEART